MSSPDPTSSQDAKSSAESSAKSNQAEPAEAGEEVTPIESAPPPPPSKSGRKKRSIAPPPPKARSAGPKPQAPAKAKPSASVPPAPPPPPVKKGGAQKAASLAQLTNSVAGEPPTISPDVVAPNAADEELEVEVDDVAEPPVAPPPKRASLVPSPAEVAGTAPRPPGKTSKPAKPPPVGSRAPAVSKVPAASRGPKPAASHKPEAPGAKPPSAASPKPPPVVAKPPVAAAGEALSAPTEAAPEPVQKAPPQAPVEAAPVPAAHVPMTAATDSLLQISGVGELPTRFDVDARERHASPWTEEKQAEALRDNARQLCDLFVRELAKKADKSRQARLNYEAARLYEAPLGELESAAKHFEQAYRLAPNHIPSVRGARRTLLGLKRYQQAVKLFDAEAEAVPDAEQKALLLYHKGSLLDTHLGQRSEARDAFEKASELAPRNLAILKAAALAQEQAGAWEPLLRTFERCASTLAEQPSQRAIYLAQMARVCSVRLRDLPRAVELYKAAFAADPHAPGVLSSLKELLYRKERWGELVEVLEQEAQLVQQPEARAFAKFRVARVCVERLADVEAGIRALEHASSLAPKDQTILSELIRLYEITERWEELASASERLFALLNKPPVEQLHWLGQIYEEKLGQQERAIERYSQALAQQPDYRPALLSLEGLRQQRGEWAEVVQMLNAEAGACNDLEQRAALHARMADICEEKLGSAEYAVKHHKKALELRPGYEPSYKALVRLLSASRNFYELIEVYERGVEQASTNEEKITTLFQIGRLEEDALSKPASAVSTYRRILDLDAHNMEAIHAVQRAAERGEVYEQLVDALELEANKSMERARQLTLRHRIATILEEKLRDPEGAISKLESILEVDPAYAPAIASLARIFASEERYDDLLATFGRELAITRLASSRAALLCKMAELCEKRLGEPTEAINNYRKAVQAEPKHLPAVQALRRVCTKQNDYKEVARLLEMEAGLVEDDAQRVRSWFLLGEVQENHLAANDKALDAYSKALAIDPDYRPAVDGCLRLLEQSHNFKQLKDRLVEEQSGASEPSYAADAGYQAGELSRDHLKQMNDAATAFEQVLEKSPGHQGALLALERLYAQLGNKQGLGDLYLQQAKVLQGPGSGIAAHKSRLHLLEGQETPEPDALKQAYFSVLRLAPADTDALLGLERVALAEQDPQLIGQIDAKLGVSSLDRQSISAYQTRLAEAMDARGDNAALEVYRSALAHDPENLAAARGISRVAQRTLAPELLAEAAESEARLLQQPAEAARLLVLAADKLRAGGNVDAAIARLTRALEIDPDHAQAASALIELQAQSAGVDALIENLSKAAATAGSPERRAQLWNNVARLHSDYKADTGAAIAAAQRASREQPTNIETHVLLSQFFASAKKWVECTNELQGVLKLHPTDEVRFSALLQLATIQHEQLDKSALASNNATAALELQPNSREALQLLLSVQLARDELSKAADTAQRLVEVSSSAKEKADALYHSAKLERHRRNQEQAIAAFKGAISILGMEGSAAREFKTWLESLGRSADFAALADALTAFLSQNGLSSDQTLPAHLELGRVLYDKLDEPERGLRELQAALSLTPGDVTLRAEIAERVEGAGQYEEAVRQYRELLRHAPHAIQHWRSLSKCYDGLGRQEQARLCLAPLVALNDAQSSEFDRYGAVVGQPANLRAASFDEAALRAVEVETPVTGPAVELLQALAPALHKLYPVPFESYGVSKGERLTSRMNNSLRHTADRVANIFGVTEFELYVHRGTGAGISVEMSEAPALLVSANVASLSEAEQVFLFARVLANVARGIAVVDKLPRQEVHLLLACATRTHDRGFGSELGDAETLDAQTKRISKAMPWFSGNKLEPAARAYASAQPDADAWYRNARIAAARAGALIADDLAVCLGTLTREGADDAFVEQVASFISSDTALALKRKLSG